MKTHSYFDRNTNEFLLSIFHRQNEHSWFLAIHILALKYEYFHSIQYTEIVDCKRFMKVVVLLVALFVRQFRLEIVVF